jgi:hypothetical protein
MDRLSSWGPGLFSFSRLLGGASGFVRVSPEIAAPHSGNSTFPRRAFRSVREAEKRFGTFGQCFSLFAADELP